MMCEMCGDSRFEIIAKAKKDMLDSTNIESSADEMAVLDNILFRCWQMGWLDRYAEKESAGPKDLDDLLASYEQVKKERDAAVKDIDELLSCTGMHWYAACAFCSMPDDNSCVIDQNTCKGKWRGLNTCAAFDKTPKMRDNI